MQNQFRSWSWLEYIDKSGICEPSFLPEYVVWSVLLYLLMQVIRDSKHGQ